jgi:hypothetical protein
MEKRGGFQMSDVEFDDSPHNDTNVRTIIEFIDNEFYSEAIKEQIFDSLDCNNVDYIEQFRMKMEEISQKYDEADYSSILLFEEQLYRDTISWIEERYTVEIEYDDDSLKRISYEMYKFFVIELKLITTSFLLNYIIESYNDLLPGIPEDLINTQVTDKLDPNEDKNKYIAVSNVDELIKQVSYLDFDFEMFIRYASRAGDIESLSEKDEDGNPSISWKFIDESDLVQTILYQIVNGEYDRTIILSITDNLITVFDIKIKLDEENG